MTRTGAGTGRNVAVFAGSVVAVGVLMLYPTSTNRGTAHHIPGQGSAPAGVVVPSAAPGPTSSPRLVINGKAAGTRYGPVQVQIRVVAGRIVGARAIEYPQSSGVDIAINAQAIPELNQETVSAQSAHIDTISGATYTSQGYERSLQSAIDFAHL